MADPRVPNKASGIENAVALFQARLGDYVGDAWEGRSSMPGDERMLKMGGVLLEFCELLEYVDNRTSAEVGGTPGIKNYLKVVTDFAVEHRNMIRDSEELYRAM